MSIKENFPNITRGPEFAFKFDSDGWHKIRGWKLEDKLPDDENQRKKCLDHINKERKGSELWNELIDEELYPRRGTKPSKKAVHFITQLSCEGTGCSPDECGLKIKQFDPTTREVIREIRASDL